MRALRVTAAVVASLLLVAACIYAVLQAREPAPAAAPVVTAAPTEAPAAASPAPAPAEAAPPPGPGRWLDGVVCISLVDERSTSRFSGFLAEESGLVVTTAHGVVDGARYRATFRDGRIADAVLLDHDPELDLAVLDVGTAGGAKPLALAPLDAIVEGAELWLLGCPAGGELTVSRGIVASRPTRARPGAGPALFHVDAKAFPGSSGGPLVSSSGQVLGIVKGVLENRDGQLASLPLAIPGRLARAMVSRGWDERNQDRVMSGATAATWLERGLDAESDEAKASAYRTCIDANDHSAACRFNLALLAERDGEVEVARSAYRELVQQRPDFAGAQQNLIALEVDAGRLDEAERVCDDALVMLSAPAEIANNCGLVARQLGDTTKARTRFDLALKLDPGYALAHLNRAVLLDEDLGRCTEAVVDYRAVLESGAGGADREAATRAIERCEGGAP